MRSSTQRSLQKMEYENEDMANHQTFPKGNKAVEIIITALFDNVMDILWCKLGTKLWLYRKIAIAK